jgi:hypothetical protein
MLALLPVPDARRDLAILVAMDKRDDVLLYYGFSTGGAYLCRGEASFARQHRRLRHEQFPVTAESAARKYEWLMTARRAPRERGTRTSSSSTAISTRCNAPSFGSKRCTRAVQGFQDTFILQCRRAVGGAARLWNALLPAALCERGFPALRENLDLCFPDEKLASIRVLDLYSARRCPHAR